MEKQNEPRCWTCGAEAIAVSRSGRDVCALCLEAERNAAMTCPTNHDRLRADDAAWSALPLVGVQAAPSVPYRVEIRNCAAGHSLARKVAA